MSKAEIYDPSVAGMDITMFYIKDDKQSDFIFYRINLVDFTCVPDNLWILRKTSKRDDPDWRHLGNRLANPVSDHSWQSINVPYLEYSSDCVGLDMTRINL